MTTNQEQPGMHGIDFGDGFLAVFCERENLLAMYPHTCPDAPLDEAAVARVRADLAAAREPVYDPTDPIQRAAAEPS